VPEGDLGILGVAKSSLVKEGNVPQFGARPLKRAIQEHLLDPLATKLLDGSDNHRHEPRN